MISKLVGLSYLSYLKAFKPLKSQNHLQFLPHPQPSHSQPSFLSAGNKGDPPLLRSPEPLFQPPCPGPAPKLAQNAHHPGGSSRRVLSQRPWRAWSFTPIYTPLCLGPKNGTSSPAAAQATASGREQWL